MNVFQDAYDEQSIILFLTVFLVGDVILYTGLLLARHQIQKRSTKQKKKSLWKEILIALSALMADILVLVVCSFVAVYPCVVTRGITLYDGTPDVTVGKDYSSLSTLSTDVLMPYSYINYPYVFDRSLVSTWGALLYDDQLNFVAPIYWISKGNTFIPYDNFVDSTKTYSFDLFASEHPELVSAMRPENHAELLKKRETSLKVKQTDPPRFLRKVFSGIGLLEYNSDLYVLDTKNIVNIFKDNFYANEVTVAVEETENGYRLLAAGQTDVVALNGSESIKVYHIYFAGTTNYGNAMYHFYLRNWLNWAFIGFAILLFLFLVIAVVKFRVSERKLLQSHRDLLISISHELKTPMQVIRMYGDELQHQSAENPELHNMAERLCKEINKMDNRLLEVSRYNKLDTLKLRKGLFWLDEVLIDIADEFVPLMLDKNVNLDVDKIEQGVAINADEDRIRAAIHNLFSNAVKFTPEGGEIKVMLSKGKRRVRLTVFNSGSHISEKRQRLIWQAFVKDDIAKDNAKRGTGLGLPIVKGVVQMHRGRCGCANSNNGVIFWFELPVK